MFDAKPKFYIVDALGNPQPVSKEVFWIWMSTLGSPIVGDDRVGPLRIVTAFTGIDYSFGIGKRRLLWETAVFSSEITQPLISRRWASTREARLGHTEGVLALLLDAERGELTENFVAHAALLRLKTWSDNGET